MTNTQKISLIAAATVLSALTLPRSSSAQFPPDAVYGEWSGVESFDISVHLGNHIDTYSGSTPAILSILNNSDGFMMEISGGQFDVSDVRGQGQLTPADAFGPTTATGSFFMDDGPGGLDVGNFFVTYQSILADGRIDVGNRGAVADLSTTYEIETNEGVGLVFAFATFSTAPEPSSIVHAGLAVLVIALVAWIRGYRPRRWAQQA